MPNKTKAKSGYENWRKIEKRKKQKNKKKIYLKR